ncbi:MAG: thermonuclease family protein [Candidatus Izimaplasma sp.]|nr:thermonuclease family protein [Candidatus Izimaplasma bacterium]
MIKKVSLFLVITFILILSGCTSQTDSEILLNVKENLVFSESTELTDNISLPTTDNEEVSITWQSSYPNVLNTNGEVTRPGYFEGDKNVTLTAVMTLNDITLTKVFNFTVLALEKPDDLKLNTDYTDELKMDFSYETKDFIADGVGKVDLVRCIDGDTARFTENNQTFTVRFLGIDTPESTYKFDPWGTAASAFTCEKLENAETIVLEADSNSERTDGNGRYLSWIWYDGRLINLELIEEAYSGSQGAGNLKYENILYEAELKTQLTERRIWGEDDPDFDYSLEGVHITLEELITNQEQYVSQKVVVEATISRTVSGHPYLQDGDYGIYLYKGYSYTTKLAEGNRILLSGVTLTYYPDKETGSPQLTGFTRENLEVISEGNIIVPNVTTIPTITVEDIGTLIELHDLTVISVYENTDNSAFTVTVEDALGNQITIRREAGVEDTITPELFTEGTMFDIVAPLSRYMGNYQLMISKLDDINFK